MYEIIVTNSSTISCTKLKRVFLCDIYWKQINPLSVVNFLFYLVFLKTIPKALILKKPHFFQYYCISVLVTNWHLFLLLSSCPRVCTVSQWTVWIMQRHSSPQLCGWVTWWCYCLSSHNVTCVFLLSLTRITSFLFFFYYSAAAVALSSYLNDVPIVVFQLTTHQELWTYIVTNLASVYIREGNRHQEVSEVITAHVFKLQQLLEMMSLWSMMLRPSYPQQRLQRADTENTLFI